MPIHYLPDHLGMHAVQVSSRTGNRTLESISLTTDHRGYYFTPTVATVPRIHHRVFSYSVLFVSSRIHLALSQYAK